jgi:hypothetical protein
MINYLVYIIIKIQIEKNGLQQYEGILNTKFVTLVC